MNIKGSHTNHRVLTNDQIYDWNKRLKDIKEASKLDHLDKVVWNEGKDKPYVVNKEKSV